MHGDRLIFTTEDAARALGLVERKQLEGAFGSQRQDQAHVDLRRWRDEARLEDDAIWTRRLAIDGLDHPTLMHLLFNQTCSRLEEARMASLSSACMCLLRSRNRHTGNEGRIDSV